MEKENLKIEDYLKKVGFSQDDIEYILEYATNEIDRKVLYEKIKYLILLGLNPKQVIIIIEEDLTFVTEPLELIKENVDILKKYLNENEIINTLEVTPEILTVKSGELKQNIKLLSIVINNDEYLKIIIQDRGEILTYKPDYLSNKLSFFVENGLKDKILNIIIQDIEIFDLENVIWQRYLL